MKSIHIDFAPRSVMRVVIRTRPITWFLGFIGLALCAGAMFTALDIVQQQSILEANLHRIEAKLAERVARKPTVIKFTVSETQATPINGAIAQLNLPWRDVFDAVESATPTTIALLALEPDANKHRLKGLAEAKTSDDMIVYVESLKQQAFFGTVVLTKHEINEQDPNRPLRFQFEAQWSEVSQ